MPDNTCKTITTPTLLDDALEAGASVAAFASWEMLDRAISSRPGTFVVSLWLIASGPSIKARGAVSSPRERHLSDIAPTLRVVIGLTPDRESEAMRGEPVDELLVSGF